MVIFCWNLILTKFRFKFANYKQFMMYNFRHHNEKVPVRISCIKFSVNKKPHHFLWRRQQSCCNASWWLEGNVIVIRYKSSSLKQGEELGNSWEFNFQYSRSLDEVINKKFLEKECLLFHFFSFKQIKERTVKYFLFNHIVNSYDFSNI